MTQREPSRPRRPRGGDALGGSRGGIGVEASSPRSAAHRRRCTSADENHRDRARRTADSHRMAGADEEAPGPAAILSRRRTTGADECVESCVPTVAHSATTPARRHTPAEPRRQHALHAMDAKSAADPHARRSPRDARPLGATVVRSATDLRDDVLQACTRLAEFALDARGPGGK